MKCVIGILVVQLLMQCRSRGLPEESVISYQKPGTESEDVYRQIANNLAEKITSPIYSLINLGKNYTESLLKNRWGKIETLDESEEVNNLKPLTNDIEDRDVEQLSIEALQKEDKKPEKIVLFSRDLQAGRTKSHFNYTDNDIDSIEFNDDDVDAKTDEKAKEGGFIYFLELVGSFFQLALGAILSLFKPSSS